MTIQAMQAGVAVVAASHGGLLDVGEHNITVLLLQPRNVLVLADAIASLAADTLLLLRLRLGEAGRLRQQKLFSIKSKVATLRAALP